MGPDTERHEQRGNAAPGNAGAPRLLSIDAFRGITVAAMLLVNNPGSWGAVFDPLEHAAWHGWTPTDLIFPFFLFVVGITTHLSLRGERTRGSSDSQLAMKIGKRFAIIFLLGVALNAFPFVQLGEVQGIDDPTVIDRAIARFETVRIPGVLQRIALVYLVVGFWELCASKRRVRVVASAGELVAIAAILGGYWAALTLVPVPDTGRRGADVLDVPSATLAAWSDRAVFGVQHLYRQTTLWDPEGALSTIPAVATGLLGLLAGRWIAGGETLKRKIALLTIAGFAGIAVGLAWDTIFPINKNLWTSSYVVFTAGLAAVGIAACAWLIDLRSVRAAAKPWVVFGVNPLLAFVGSGVMARILTSIVKVDWEGKRVPMQRALYETAFASWLPPHVASLAWAVAFVGIWALLLWPLWKRGIFLKV